jgi:hypothetical protein
MDVKQAIMTAVAVGIIAPVVIDVNDWLKQHNLDIVVKTCAVVGGAIALAANYLPDGPAMAAGEFWRIQSLVAS